jgi:hypothetical protein
MKNCEPSVSSLGEFCGGEPGVQDTQKIGFYVQKRESHTVRGGMRDSSLAFE